MPEHRTMPRLPREEERGSAGPPGALSDATRMASSIDARKEGWGGRRAKGEGASPSRGRGGKTARARAGGCAWATSDERCSPVPEHRPAPRRPERDGERVWTGPPGSLSDVPEERLVDRSGSRVRVRMRCERTTRRERGAAATTADELRVPPAAVAYGGTSPGAPPALRPSGAGTPARALLLRALACFLSRLPLGALLLSLASSASPRRRASRIPPVRALSRLLGFALAAREPVFPPHALWPRPAFFRCSPERPPLDHQRAAGRGAKDTPKRPERSNEPTPEKAAAAAAAHLLSARPVNPARERPLTTVSGAESALSPTDEKERHPKKKLRSRWRRLPAKAPTAADVYLDVTGGRKLERRLWPLRSRSAPTTPRTPRRAETG